MKININNTDFCAFLKCVGQVTDQIGYVALDLEDISTAFSEAKEVDYFVATGDTPRQTCERLRNLLPKERYSNGLVVFSIRSDVFDSIAGEAENAFLLIGDNCFCEDSDLLWGLYKSDQGEICITSVLGAKRGLES